MSAMPQVTADEANHFDLLELDDTPTRNRIETPATPTYERQLDLVDDVEHTVCLTCHQARPVNELSVCQGCATVAAEAAEETVFGALPDDTSTPAQLSSELADLAAIATESTGNAAVQGIGSVTGGEMRGVGFSTAEGYLTSLRHGVKRETGEMYIRILREHHGIEVNPGTIAPWIDAAPALPEGVGVRHVPAGHVEGSAGIFERPRAERRFIVGPSQNETERQAAIDLRPGELVAGSVAEGNGILVGWRGDSQMTRGALLEALDRLGHKDWAPKPKDARAQAGRAVGTLTGYHIKAERKAQVIRRGMAARPSGEHRWFVGQVNTMSTPGENYGTTVLVMTLSPSGELTGAGDQELAAKVIADYKQRCADELYTSADLTSWLAETLKERCGAVNYAVGWYIPANHRGDAIALCNAVSATGWGNNWLGSKERPALPIATCDELRDGLVRGLKDEVAELIGKLETERAKARQEREDAIAAARAEAIANGEDPSVAHITVRRRGDIGEDRAQTYLLSMRDISRRVLAYGELLGEERVASARGAVLDVVAELEGLLAADYQGIGARFAAVFDEIADDIRRERAREAAASEAAS